MNVATIGTGVIVHRFLDAVKLSDNTHAVAVYSRSVEKGKELANQYGIDTVYTALEDMLKDATIDTVYIASPNSLHYPQAKMCLEAGKNVIGEKPFTSTLQECDDLIRIAKEKHLFLFEAITTSYLPNYQIIKDNLHKVGDIKLITCNFSQFSSKYNAFKQGLEPNVFNPLFSGGALMDINIYNLHFVMGLFGKPVSYQYIPNMKEGIDTSGILILNYPTCKAVCIGAKDCSADNSVFIQGDEGSIKVFGSSPGVCMNVSYLPTKGDMIGKQDKGDGRIPLGIEQIQHMTYEVNAFEKMVTNNDYEQCYEILEYTRNVMEVLYKARIEAGIHFGVDDIC